MGTTGAEDRVRGKAQQAKGSVKKAAGKATGDRRLQAKGSVDKAKGKATEIKGKVKDEVSRHRAGAHHRPLR